MADAKIEVTYAIDAVISEELARLRAALAAEQMRAEAWKATAEAAEQERDALATPMPCGHAARYAFGVSECVMCDLGSALSARDKAREEFRLENIAYHKAADRAMVAERERGQYQMIIESERLAASRNAASEWAYSEMHRKRGDTYRARARVCHKNSMFFRAAFREIHAMADRLAEDGDAQEARADALAAELAQVRAMLVRVQWGDDADTVCPVCLCGEYTGHSLTCELAALLPGHDPRSAANGGASAEEKGG